MESNTWTASSQLALEITAPKPWNSWELASTASTNPWQDSSNHSLIGLVFTGKSTVQETMVFTIKYGGFRLKFPLNQPSDSNLWQPKWHCQDLSRQGANDICLNGLCLHGEQKLQSILPLLTSQVDQLASQRGIPNTMALRIWSNLG